jgi:hypothetical protein
MANQYGPKIITNNLILNMDFGNSKCYPGTGTSCTDLSTSSLIGELVNSPSFTSNINNKYFSFNGNTNSRLIRIPNSTLLDTQTPSVEVWIKTNATTQGGFWFEKGNVNTQYSLFQEGGNIQWRMVLNGTMNTFSTNTINAGVNTSNWFQVVGTYSSGNRKLYVNGILKNSDSQTGTIATNAGGMSIGAYGGYNGGRDYYYNGDIAIVRVYNKQLTDQEVFNNYSALKGRFGI